MSEIMATEPSSLNLDPEAWKYKASSGYSVTEGMEYEVFTKGFREIYDQFNRQQEYKLQMLEENIFIENDTLRHEEEEVRQYLFQEIKRESKQQIENKRISVKEGLFGIGIIVVLFLLLIRFTFKKNKRHRRENKYGGRIHTDYYQM